MNHLGKRVRELRKKRRMTQGDLAEGICNRSYISQIEKGYVIPTPELLAQLAQRLDSKLEDLWSEPESPSFTQVEITNSLRHIVNNIDTNEWEIARKWLNKLHGTPMPDYERSVYLWGKAVIAQVDQHFDQAEQFFLESIELARNLDEVIPLIRSLNSLGSMYCKTRQSKKAVPYVNEALQLVLRHEIGGLLRISVMHTTGLMHYSMGEYISAIEQLKNAIQLNHAYRINYKSEELHLLLGICHYHKTEYEQAEREYQRALDLLAYQPNPRLEASVYHNQGILYAATGQLELAVSKLKQSMQMSDETGSSHWLNNSRIELAKVLKLKGCLQEALDLCLQVMKQNTTDHMLAETRLLIAELYGELGKAEEALKELGKALDFFSNADSPVFLAKAYRTLAKINLMFGRIQTADDFYERHLAAQV